MATYWENQLKEANEKRQRAKTKATAKKWWYRMQECTRELRYQ